MATRGVLVATLAATLLLSRAPVAGASQASPASTPPQAVAPPDPEADGDRAAPVLVGGEPILWITVGVGPYSPQARADRIGQRLREIVRDRTIHIPTVTVTENEASS